MARIAHELVAVEILPEHPLAKFDRCGLVGAIEPGGVPGLLARLDDESAGVLIEAIRMQLKPAPLCRLERKREGVELAVRAEPDVAALAHVYVGLEVFRM